MNCSARILLGDLNRRSKWHCSLVLRSLFEVSLCRSVFTEQLALLCSLESWLGNICIIRSIAAFFITACVVMQPLSLCCLCLYNIKNSTAECFHSGC